MSVPSEAVCPFLYDSSVAANAAFNEMQDVGTGVIKFGGHAINVISNPYDSFYNTGAGIGNASSFVVDNPNAPFDAIEQLPTFINENPDLTGEFAGQLLGQLVLNDGLGRLSTFAQANYLSKIKHVGFMFKPVSGLALATEGSFVALGDLNQPTKISFQTPKLKLGLAIGEWPGGPAAIPYVDVSESLTRFENPAGQLQLGPEPFTGPSQNYLDNYAKIDWSAPNNIERLNYVPTSGAILEGQAERTSTILGNYQMDMKHIVAEMGNIKSMDFGAKPGGFNVLNVPDNLYETPAQFWSQYNQLWLAEAVQRGDNIIFATTPKMDVLTRLNPVTGKLELSGFGKEYFFLRQNGMSLQLSY